MTERRSLIEGVKTKPDTSRAAEEAFIYGANTKSVNAQSEVSQKAEPVPVNPTQHNSRVPLTTRIRADVAQALKRASLERQLEGVEPNTVQDILEVALEPWLKTNGYLQ